MVSYDDEEIARHLFPPLTTSIQPHMAMGQWAIEQLEAPAAPGGKASDYQAGVPAGGAGECKVGGLARNESDRFLVS